MNLSRFTGTRRPWLWSGLMLAVAATLSGCATSRKLLRYGDVETRTEVSEAIFLDLRTNLPRTVFVSETSSVARDVTLRPVLERELRAAGYQLVETPLEATYVIQLNHLQLAEVELDDDEGLFEAMGSALGAGVATGGVAGLFGADAGLAGDLGLIVGLASFIVDARTKHLAHTLTTEVRVTEAIPGGEGSPESARHATRIVSGASKVNLNWDESLPHLIRGVGRAVTGLLPSAAGAPTG